MTRHLIEWVSEWDSKRIRLETFESISPFFENQFWLKTMQRRHDTMTTMMTKKVWQNKQKLLNSRLCLTHAAGRLVASDKRIPGFECNQHQFKKRYLFIVNWWNNKNKKRQEKVWLKLKMMTLVHKPVFTNSIIVGKRNG